jgi:hypothetical protein
MSSNNLNNTKPFIYCEDNNCDFNINNQTNLDHDNCQKLFKDKQSESPGIYNLNRYNDTTCGIPTVMEVASQNPTINFKDGYGITECYIDDDSKLRVGRMRKNPKCPNQLFTRPYATVPYMGRGSGDSYLESQIRIGEDTVERKQCNTLAGVNIKNVDPNYMPMIDHLKNNIQNPVHIVPEVALDGWVRGGAPSRQIVKDIEYLEKCGSKYQKMAAQKYNNNY